MKLRFLYISALVLTFFLPAGAQSLLQKEFASPRRDSRPWAFWNWKLGEMSPESITEELELMKKTGFGGICLMATGDALNDSLTQAGNEALRKEMFQYWKTIHHTMNEVSRLGLKMGLKMSDGIALPGTSWLTPKEAMQKVVWSDTIVGGGSLRNFALPQPEVCEGYYEDIAAFAFPAEHGAEQAFRSSASVGIGGDTVSVSRTTYVNPEDVMQLPLYQGRLTAILPEGTWHILRIGHTVAVQSPSSEQEKPTLKCDKFSLKAVNDFFNHYIEQLLGRTDSELVANTVKYLHLDSWAPGNQNWSGDFLAEFEKRRGYSLTPFLPVLAGVPMENAARSAQVAADVRITIDELAKDVLRQVAATSLQQKGFELYAEGVPQDGKLTKIDAVWAESPAMIKPLLDGGFVSGTDKVFLRVDAEAQPSDDSLLEGLSVASILYQRPDAGFETDSVWQSVRDSLRIVGQQKQSWWQESSPVLTYAARCRTLLSYGKESADSISSLQVSPPAKNIAWTHRSGDEMDLFFVTSSSEQAQTCRVSFPVSGHTPELWNAVTGTIVRPAEWEEKTDGRTEITLHLPAYGSVFVVFPKENRTVEATEITVTTPLSIKINEWTVNLPDVRKSIVRSVLSDWQMEDDKDIRDYFGRSFYRGLIMWKTPVQGRIILRLGDVDRMATVRVNSINCGTAWTAPYEIDITDALRKGSNVVEVEVMPSGWRGPAEFVVGE